MQRYDRPHAWLEAVGRQPAAIIELGKAWMQARGNAKLAEEFLSRADWPLDGAGVGKSGASTARGVGSL